MHEGTVSGRDDIKMRAMILTGISNIRENRTPLQLIDMPEPKPEDKRNPHGGFRLRCLPHGA